MSQHKAVSVVFLGTSAFAIPCLRTLVADKHFDVKLVITQPDRPVGRKHIVTPSPVKIAALELGLPIEQPEKMNAQFSNLRQGFGRQAPDFLIVVSYGQILSKEILAWPTIAAVNVHASLLPALRGASPLQHAILEGLSETGVTVQRMVEELDAGPILSRQSIPIDPRETFKSLHDKLSLLGADLLKRTLKVPLCEKEQDHRLATFCKKLQTADGIIDPSVMTATQIDRMVRALCPSPGVRYGEAKILSSDLQETPESFPLSCAGSSTLFVSKIQPAGGKPMTGKEYLRGHAIPSNTL